jgi:hypothetical protein
LAPLALLAVACSNPSEVEDRPQTLYVEAYLSPGIDTEVRLRQTVPPERFYEGYEEAVSGADVVLRTEGAAVTLDERSEEAGIYVAAHDLFPIEEGGTYHLTATHGQRQLTARTTVPFAAPVTRVVGDTITYLQQYANSFGELLHPGEFYWERSPNAAGYVIIVEAEWVSTLGPEADPLTADLDTLVATRDRIQDAISEDSLRVLDRQIQGLVEYFERNISLEGVDGRTAHWLRDRMQEDWDEQIEDADRPGQLWRKQREDLYWTRVIDYWMPVDTLRSDYWWWGVRFTGDYRITLQAADTNYFDYYSTAFNGQSGADGDAGPIFHTEGGLGVFGSYSADSFTIFAHRGD